MENRFNPNKTKLNDESVAALLEQKIRDAAALEQRQKERIKKLEEMEKAGVLYVKE